MFNNLKRMISWFWTRCLKEENIKYMRGLRIRDGMITFWKIVRSRSVWEIGIKKCWLRLGIRSNVHGRLWENISGMVAAECRNWISSSMCWCWATSIESALIWKCRCNKNKTRSIAWPIIWTTKAPGKGLLRKWTASE